MRSNVLRIVLVVAAFCCSWCPSERATAAEEVRIRALEPRPLFPKAKPGELNYARAAPAGSSVKPRPRKSPPRKSWPN